MRIHQRVLVALMLVAPFALTGCQSTTAKQAKRGAEGRWNRIRADFKLQLARQHYEAKLFGESELAATEALAFDPSLTSAYVLLAQSHLELGKPTSALRAIETARRANLDSAELTYMEGVVHETQGDLPVAGAFYAEAARKDLDRVDYVIAYAECVVGLGRPDLALTRLDNVVGRFDDDGSVLLLSAHIASFMGQKESAIRRYRLALDALGDSRIGSRELGLLLVETGRFEEAIDTLSALVDDTTIESPDDVVRHALAMSNLRVGRPMKAMSYLTPESEGQSGLVTGYVILAEAALSTNDVRTGLKATTMGVRLAPDDPELNMLHAVALWRHGDHARAERRLRIQLERDLNDATVHCLLGEVLRSRGEIEQAREHFQTAADLTDEPVWSARALESLSAEPLGSPVKGVAKPMVE